MTYQIQWIRFLLIFIFTVVISCSDKSKQTAKIGVSENLIAILDTIWRKEQTPIRLRDSVIKIYGAESTEADVYQKIYRKNHTQNIIKVKDILDTYGWPETTQIGTQGNLTICNVLQHADQATREYYIPLMKQAVLDKKLEPRFLVRAKDRIATDNGELQIYGGQMKYYRETKSFNVWPVFDPENINKRRAVIGLEPIAEFLKNRFDFDWNLEEQLKRSQEFQKERLLKTKFLTDEIPRDIPFEFKKDLIPENKLIHKGTFSPDLDAYYYTISDKNFEKFDVYVIENNYGHWSKPKKAFFNSKYNEHGMSFSPNGNKLFFSSTRPVEMDRITSTWHIWKSDKVDGKWTTPTFVDIPNLREKLVSHPTITNSGTLYFHSSNLDYSDMDIYYSKQINGAFTDAIKTTISMNSNIGKCTPFVSANENYLIFASIENQLNLMITFNDGNGKWINTKKLNPKINTNGQGNPYVTPDNKFLFYTTGEHLKKDWSVNWVSIESQLNNNSKNKLSDGIVTENGIICTDEKCKGTYKGSEFINGSDIAHQFSNTMSVKVGNQLKALYNSGNYSKVDFSNIEMTTEGMGSGDVTYRLTIPFVTVRKKCDAYTAFDHVGGWDHSPALAKRKAQLKTVLIEGDQLDISDLKTTKEGLQEYWIQWKHQIIQSECE